MGQYLKTNYVKKSIEKIDSKDLKWKKKREKKFEINK